ncbi:hypothetical protein Leryth_020111 [Lithospermum erythrorhizon]|nr:hypothetical protein Leryth_020111 [Lithospermum erythrorhizon]
MDINGLRQLVYESLQSEKYIVVFDDVWHRTDWDAIHLAFPRNEYGSRVVITTRNNELTKAASNTENGGFIYHLKPLAEEEARQLFCKKAFGGSSSCPPHLTEVCKNLLTACEGLPLAIVVIGSALATKSRRTEEWDLFYRSLGEVSKSNNSLNVMMKLLSLSYYDLPNYLRVCLLYLSIFPEDAMIEKMTLIRLWIAEGFVQEKLSMSMEEVAEGHLYELLDRSLLQVAEIYHDGRVKAVRIHDIVRKMIILQAKEQNITTIISSKGVRGSTNKARRIAIHGSFDEGSTQLESICKSLHSLVFFESTGLISKQALDILLHDGRRLIKVLDLRGVPLEEIPNELFSLVHLKYLSLRNTGIKSIPKSIEKLLNLETLNLKGTLVTKLPREIVKLQKLRHILVYSYREAVSGLVLFNRISSFSAPYKISELKSLQKICFIEADEMGNVKIVKEIGELTKLRRLGIMKLRTKDGKEFCSSLEKLAQLRSLSIVSFEEEEVIDLQYSLSSNLIFLRTLELWGRMEQLPRWISSLQGLTYVSLRWSRVRDDPLQYLQDLPNLVKIYLECVYEGEELCFKAGGFPALKWLTLWSLPELRLVKVEEGSMPLLEELKFGDCIAMVEVPSGIQHLEHLQYLRFYDMPTLFVKALENMDKESKDYKWILQLPRLVVSDMVNQRWNNRFLHKATGKFI